MAKFVRRNRVAVALATIAFVALAAGAAWIVIRTGGCAPSGILRFAN
jgi:hypothetical protein